MRTRKQHATKAARAGKKTAVSGLRRVWSARGGSGRARTAASRLAGESVLGVEIIEITESRIDSTGNIDSAKLDPSNIKTGLGKKMSTI